MLVLGIETSCDETGAAIVGGDRRILANLVHSQITDHRPYGGVVPEIAARSHLDHLDALVRRAVADAGLTLDRLDAIAATGGPGLIGGVIVGVMTAKALAAALGKPFVAVNHLEAHALTARLTAPEEQEIDFPYLLLLVSGGHCQLLIVEGVGRYRKLGSTIDDAAGEAFDKAAAMLGLGFPGGPAVEAGAANGDPKRFSLPRPMLGRPGADFSFSGLKTALRQMVASLPSPIDPQAKADLAAGLQAAIVEVLVDRTDHAIDLFARHHGQAGTLVVAGGVAANRAIRTALEDLAVRRGMRLAVPPAALCTDNAAMVAWAGLERYRLGLVDGMDFAPRPRWPLDEAAASAGAKA
ncbi:MAG TPA: tRNA (adenosine(37)-N6)-threonylcarbamoyltransferase complex transferase subunit TsaD [Alphaproteobacteria bacterium]|nr:tRNA (adenosine(37)-N6)-threonylcarbamoyltransferase complex transferase subunit TsaD [Alphaproteobacteria bacterium]